MFYKIIFLDFDGVMVTFKKVVDYEYCCTDILENGCLKFDTLCVDALNHLILKSNAKIVVSSSWRYAIPENLMSEVLKRQGVTGEFIGYTPFDQPCWNKHGRGEEIKRWLSGRGVTHFAILDDTDFKWGDLSSFWIKTDCTIGLTASDVRFALHLFEGES